jgi:signal transduction histidine kinase
MVATLHATNLIAGGWSQMGRSLLGVSDAELRLVEARRQVTLEHQRADVSDQRRRELVLNVSHELRTPLASIRGHLDTLRMPPDQRPDSVDETRYLDVMSREVDRLNSLVDDLLLVARGESGQMRLELTSVDPVNVVQQVRDTMAPMASRDRHVALIVQAANAVPPAKADPARLAQVLMNLVRNAITNTPDGGAVSLQVAPEGDRWVVITVADTGAGMTPDELDRAFDRFYRTDASRTRVTGGFGLGLPISKELVAAMGGTMRAESRVGEGSRFHVQLERA